MKGTSKQPERNRHVERKENQCQREGERGRERHRERDRQTETDRQTDRQTQRDKVDDGSRRIVLNVCYVYLINNEYNFKHLKIIMIWNLESSFGDSKC